MNNITPAAGDTVRQNLHSAITSLSCAVAISMETGHPERAHKLLAAQLMLEIMLDPAIGASTDANTDATSTDVPLAPPVLINLSLVDRVSVIGPEGLVYEKYGLFINGAQLSLQDGGKTLKVLPLLDDNTDINDSSTITPQ